MGTPDGGMELLQNGASGVVKCCELATNPCVAGSHLDARHLKQRELRVAHGLGMIVLDASKDSSDVQAKLEELVRAHVAKNAARIQNAPADIQRQLEKALLDLLPGLCTAVKAWLQKLQRMRDTVATQKEAAVTMRDINLLKAGRATRYKGEVKRGQAVGSTVAGVGVAVIIGLAAGALVVASHGTAAPMVLPMLLMGMGSIVGGGLLHGGTGYAASAEHAAQQRYTTEERADAELVTMFRVTCDAACQIDCGLAQLATFARQLADACATQGGGSRGILQVLKVATLPALPALPAQHPQVETLPAPLVHTLSIAQPQLCQLNAAMHAAIGRGNVSRWTNAELPPKWEADALMDPLCLLSNDGPSPYWWSVSVLNRTTTPVVAKLTWLGRNIGAPLTIKPDTMVRLCCYRVHYWLSVELGDEMVACMVFCGSDWVLYRRDADQTLALIDRRQLQDYITI